MQKIKVALLAIMTVFTFSCSSDDDNNNGGGQASDETYINFKIDGEQVNMIEPGTITSMMASISASENTGSDIRNINFTIPVDATVGTHALTDASPADLTAYSVQYSYGDLWFDATSGTFTITSIGEEYMEATFSFTGEYEGVTYNVTDGELRAYKPNND